VRIDLHVHTNASDGQYTPSEVVALARGFAMIAICDHDTTDGIAEAQHAAAAVGSPIIIPAIELSALAGESDVHMLGYYVTVEDSAFQTKLRAFRESRLTRGQEMVEKLASLGMPLAWSRVIEIAEGVVGRPHIARAMVEAGYVENIKEAFTRFIGNEGPAYVARDRMTPVEAVELIHEAGGVAVLAHPALVSDWQSLMPALIAGGLDGVEVAHPANDGTTRLNLRAIAKRHDLIMTGGSDFHGPQVKPHNALGSITPPVGAVTLLRERAKRYVRA